MTDETRFPSLADAVEPARRPALERLREAWRVRLRPADAAEEQLIEAIVARAWRAGRLDAIEERVMRALLEDRTPDTLPTLGTLLRCRARLDKDRAQIEAEREELRATRPQPAAREAEGAPAALVAEPAAPTAEPAAPVAEPPAPGPSAVAAVEADLAGWPAGEGASLDPVEAAEAWYERRSAAGNGSAGRLPPEVEELVAGMWRPGGGSETIPRRLAAAG